MAPAMMVFAAAHRLLTLPAIATAARAAPAPITARAMPYSARSWAFLSPISFFNMVMAFLLLSFRSRSDGAGDDGVRRCPQLVDVTRDRDGRESRASADHCQG